MSLWKQITHLVKDPPPEHILELSEAGIAYSRNGETGFQAFEPGVLAVSPTADNLLQPNAVASALARIAPPNGNKRRPATVILPDYAARVSLLDFDSFPSSPEEQLPLVRFRVKKTIPFDIDSAAVSYWAQPASTNAGVKKVEVVAVTVAMEILARYEAVFRTANLYPGEVTTSGLAALNLCGAGGVVVIAKLTGNVLTVMAVDDGQLKLFRCLMIADAGNGENDNEEILAVLNPTFAYIEDELGQKPEKLMLCGFAKPLEGLNIEMEPLRSHLGTANSYNAGLLGYLEGAA
jgi:type IV pilus assembly protein PilM